MSTLVSENIEIVLPDGVEEESVEIITSPEATTEVEIAEPVAELEIEATGETTDITGAKLEDSTIVAANTNENETSKIDVSSNIFKQNTITNAGASSVQLNISGSNFKKSTFDAGNKKKDDVVSFKNGATVTRGTILAGKGDDTVTFNKATKFKGKTTIDLGKGGKDSIILKANKLKKGRLVITNFTRKDTITVGDETFTFKDIKNGAEIPGIKIRLA